MKNAEIVEILDRVFTYLSNPIFSEEMHSEEFKKFMEDKNKLKQLKEGFENEQFLFLGKYDFDYENETPDWNFRYEKATNSSDLMLWDEEE